MDYFKGEKEFFPGIGKIQFEGRESKNPLAMQEIINIFRIITMEVFCI